MGKTINMGDFDPLLGNLEEYVNKQGCTLGKEAEILQELLHCIQYCYIHGVITDSVQMQTGNSERNSKMHSMSFRKGKI